jgi:hypothetical protein
LTILQKTRLHFEISQQTPNNQRTETTHAISAVRVIWPRFANDPTTKSGLESTRLLFQEVQSTRKVVKN